MLRKTSSPGHRSCSCWPAPTPAICFCRAHSHSLHISRGLWRIFAAVFERRGVRLECAVVAPLSYHLRTSLCNTVCK